MTQREAVVKAFEKLGGRAQLKDVFPVAIELIGQHSSQQIKKNIQGEIYHHPELFRRSPGKPRGWWELVSFQEEVALRDERIGALEARVQELQQVPTEADFIRMMVTKAKRKFKRKPDVADELRDLLDELGQTDAANELDGWIKDMERHTSQVTIHGPLNDIHDNGHVTAGM